MKKILIVEDDPGIIDAISAALQMEGYEVVPVIKAKEAISRIEKEKPDLVLLDLLLSGINGKDICIQIKNTPSLERIPVIMLSAHPSAQSYADEAQADAFIAKPFDLEDLLQVIADHLPA